MEFSTSNQATKVMVNVKMHKCKNMIGETDEYAQLATPRLWVLFPEN